jgi:hypothetical protein
VTSFSPLLGSPGAQAPTQPHISDHTQTKIFYRNTPPKKLKPKVPKKMTYAQLESKLENILVVILMLLVVAYFVTTKKPT